MNTVGGECECEINAQIAGPGCSCCLVEGESSSCEVNQLVPELELMQDDDQTRRPGTLSAPLCLFDAR